MVQTLFNYARYAPVYTGLKYWLVCPVCPDSIPTPAGAVATRWPGA